MVPKVEEFALDDVGSAGVRRLVAVVDVPTCRRRCCSWA